MTYQQGPLLTDSKGMGGIIAQDGFDYQVWDALTRLPAWLRNPGFEGFAVEMLEDVEARFFAPHAPSKHLLDRFQAKSGALQKSDLIDVLKSFEKFRVAHPDAARVQTLVTPALPSSLVWLCRDQNRIRKARPFYSPFPAICAASDKDFRKDLAELFGTELGDFYADYVEIDIRTLLDRATAEAIFSAALCDAFPILEDVGSRRVATAFAGLIDLVSQNRGVMLTTGLILEVFDKALGVALMPSQNLRVHIRSDRNKPEADAIEIDASEFTGDGGQFPSPDTWLSGLLEPLETTARWALKSGHKRISLTGSYRLSTAFAVGWSFRSAVGFDITIDTRSGPWATDEHPLAGAQQLPWEISYPKQLVDDRLIVSVGVLRNPGHDIKSSMGLSGDDDLLLATLPQALTSGLEAQRSVQLLKSAVSQAVSLLKPKSIDFFFAGPAAFAVALGHRWNALPSTQFHEFFASEKRYVPTVILG